MDYSVKKLVPLMLVIWATQLFLSNIQIGFALNLNDVVINEVAWSGSIDDSNDEWIELYNNTNAEIDLSGWYIEDDITTKYEIQSGTIPAKGFFLIEKTEDSILNLQADQIISLSLANTGDALLLKDSADNLIDSVNASGSMWQAGSNTTKATMERTDPTISGDIAENWNDASSSNGALSSLSSSILGTPKSVNSQTMTTGIEISVTPSVSSAGVGDTKTFTVNVSKAEDLYAYGFDIIYDPSKLEYLSVEEGDFLNKDGKTVSFLSSLENNNPGKLIIASSRLENPQSGVSGDGMLFTIAFKIIGELGEASVISFGPDSFVSDIVGQQTAKFNTATITSPGNSSVIVKDPKIENGENVYSLKVLWTAPDLGAEKYSISRKNPNGEFAIIAETDTTDFIDSNVNTGINYDYKIIAIKDGVSGEPVSVSGIENRGIKGDIDHSKRVDGRDLEKLARSYGELYAQQNYNILADLNFDGIVDGQDLIIMGSTFGLTY